MTVRERPARVTIRDVARLAGVSVTTASRALNDKDELSPEKRSSVLAAAEALQYVPSSVARALASGWTKTLGVLITDSASAVYAEILQGVEEVVERAGFNVVFCSSGESQERALRSIATFKSMQVDGALLTPVQTDRRDLVALRRAAVPVVLLLRTFADVDTDWVITDNVAGGHMAVHHLLELGHRRIGHVAGLPHISSTEGRLDGYKQALVEHQIPFDDTLVARAPNTIEGGYDAASQILGRPQRPSAIFAATNPQAVGVLKAARTLGLPIPDELALVGGDDNELSEFLEVPLTSFHQPAREIGARGAEILLERLRAGADGAPRQLVLQPTLVVRASSGAYRSRRAARSRGDS